MLQALASPQQHRCNSTNVVKMLVVQQTGDSSTLLTAQHHLWSQHTQTAPQIQWQTLSAAIMAMLASTTKAVSSTLCTMLQVCSGQSCFSCVDMSGRSADIKDIDAVPNQWGYSLNDYKAVFGDKYVHGCVPWEDEHISKDDHKKFEKLHARRVQLLQELHGLEQGIRELMK